MTDSDFWQDRLEQANTLDAADELAGFRAGFFLPELNGKPVTYFLGNSLGLMPQQTPVAIQMELDKWAAIASEGHFQGEFPWVSFHEPLAAPMAGLIGANPDEVIMMNTLTVNLHLMMATFYRPQQHRRQILIEDHAFPSDQYAIDSQAMWHGWDRYQAVLRMKPDQGQLFSTEYICQTIVDHADELALVLLPGVQYYTGQVLDIKTITETAHRFEIPVGFDLAHAVGNVELELHQWNVDFAVWCTYKYLNSGPGAIAGCFIHRRHASNIDLPRLAGWWGHDKSTRFLMGDQFSPIPTAEGWQLSNPPIFSLAPVRASLDLFQQAGGMEKLQIKTRRMQYFFRELLDQRLRDCVTVIAPAEISGCQLSLEIGSQNNVAAKTVFQRLNELGFRVDWREPNVIRVAPTPLYNRFQDIWLFVKQLEQLLKTNSRTDHNK